jgi:hypothetical protein
MICLATSLDGLELRELGPVDACEYYTLVDRTVSICPSTAIT